MYTAQPRQRARIATMSDRPRVLIVDDSPVALSFLRAVLQGTYEVDTAVDGEDAMQKAIAQTPNLIVTDSLMPKVDGFELIGLLRQHPPTATIPVVMLTSSEAADDEIRTRSPQPTALVRKSTDIEPLLREIARQLQSNQR
jgi:CheY-like chemotaxis protein